MLKRNSIERIERIRSSGYMVDDKGNVEHRKVYKSVHGKIPKNWIVHHIDCNKKKQ